MNEKRIAAGLMAWFLGALVLVLHHSLLYIGAMRQGTDNVVRVAQGLFESLPILDWVYVAAMAIVGAVLVTSGMRARNSSER